MRDINFSAARIVYVAAMHVLNNTFKFGLHGMMKALRDPSVKAIVDEIDPIKASKDQKGNRTTKKHDVGTDLPYWSVVTNFLPAYAGTGRNTRAKTAGTAIQGGGSLQVDFNLRREYTLSYKIKDVPTEPDALKYMKELVSGKVELFGGDAGVKYGDMMQKLGLEIYRTIDDTVFTPVNLALLALMYSGVGKNAAFKDAATPTAGAPIVPIECFTSDGKPNENLLEAFQQTMLENRLKGKMLVVGGSRASKYMAKQGIVAINSAGIDLAKVYASLPILFYYDPDCDSIVGANRILAFDSAAAGLCTLPEHGPDGFVNNSSWANTAYGNMAIRLEQSALDSSIAGLGNDLFEMDVDFTAEETTDNGRFPVLDITPSLLYGLYRRPVNFFYTSGSSNFLKDVTGIFCFELTVPNAA
ncbi:hypothetical protein [Runella sp.]|uniref:hypothetical protein n=1 Tax=Runella sp. TaxID=1960881 RepID=UPI003D0FA38A